MRVNISVTCKSKVICDSNDAEIIIFELPHRRNKNKKPEKYRVHGISLSSTQCMIFSHRSSRCSFPPLRTFPIPSGNKECHNRRPTRTFRTQCHTHTQYNTTKKKDNISLFAKIRRTFGMIEPSVSSIAHPIVCVMKSDKAMRMFCDNRFINSISIPDRQPTRRVDDILEQVGAATYISAFDASSGYWQIGVQEESRPYTAFVFNQAYQWKRLNFGLENAAATYQRAMEKILTPHFKYTAANIDDVSVYSMTRKEHLRHSMNDVSQTILR